MICQVCHNIGNVGLYRCMDCYDDGEYETDMCCSCIGEHLEANDPNECRVRMIDHDEEKFPSE